MGFDLAKRTKPHDWLCKKGKAAIAHIYTVPSSPQTPSYVACIKAINRGPLSSKNGEMGKLLFFIILLRLRYFMIVMQNRLTEIHVAERKHLCFCSMLLCMIEG